MIAGQGTVAVELVASPTAAGLRVCLLWRRRIAGRHGGLSAIRLATDADYRRGAGRRRLRSGRLGQRPSRHAARGGAFADGCAVAQVGKETFRLIRECVDDVITVSTDEICAAVKDILRIPARLPSLRVRWRWPA